MIFCENAPLGFRPLGRRSTDPNNLMGSRMMDPIKGTRRPDIQPMVEKDMCVFHANPIFFWVAEGNQVGNAPLGCCLVTIVLSW